MIEGRDFKFSQVVVVGQGGVGGYLTEMLAVELDGRLPIITYDDDNFAGEGLGHTRFPPMARPSTFKGDYIRNRIENVWRKKGPQVFTKRLEVKDFKVGKVTWKDILIVDCTDMAFKVREKWWTAAQTAEATLMRVSYDGVNIGNVTAYLPMLTEKEQETDEGGYRMAPTAAWSEAVGAWASIYVVHALRTGVIVEGRTTAPIIADNPMNLEARKVTDVSKDRDDEHLPDNKQVGGSGGDIPVDNRRVRRGITRKTGVDRLPIRKVRRKKADDKG